MVTTELIKILQDNEIGGISHKPRNISLCINGRYMPDPQISLSSTGDGICGPEIDLDIEGDWLEEQPGEIGHWIKHDTGHSIYYDCSRCGCAAPCTETADKILWKMANFCPDCGAKMEVEE